LANTAGDPHRSLVQPDVCGTDPSPSLQPPCQRFRKRQFVSRIRLLGSITDAAQKRGLFESGEVMVEKVELSDKCLIEVTSAVDGTMAVGVAFDLDQLAHMLVICQ
jgi:hypothetical protein